MNLPVVRPIFYLTTVLLTGCTALSVNFARSRDKLEDSIRSGLTLENGKVSFAGSLKSHPNTPVTLTLVTRKNETVCDKTEQSQISDYSGKVSFNTSANLGSCEQVEVIVATGKAAVKSTFESKKIGKSLDEIWLNQVDIVPIRVSCKGQVCSSEVKLEVVASSNVVDTTAELTLGVSFFDGRDDSILLQKEVKQIASFDKNGLALLEILEEIPGDVSVFNVEAEVEIKSYSF